MEKTVRWNIDAEELARIQLSALECSSAGKQMDITVGIVFAILMLLIIIYNLQQSGSQLSSVIVPLLIALVGIPGFLIYRYWGVPRQIRKASQKQEMMLGEHILTITDEDFQCKGPYGESRLPWRLFVRWKEMGDYLFLFQRGNLMNYLPKKSLDAETLEFIRGKVDENKIPEKPSGLSRVSRIAFAVLWTAVIAFFVIWWSLKNGSW